MNRLEKSKAPMVSNINLDEFTLVINEEENYCRLKKNIRAKYDQFGDIERDKLNKRCKIIQQNKKQSFKIKTKVKIY